MDKDKGEPVISVKTGEKKEGEEGEKVEEKDKKPEEEKAEGAADEPKTEGL